LAIESSETVKNPHLYYIFRNLETRSFYFKILY